MFRKHVLGLFACLSYFLPAQVIVFQDSETKREVGGVKIVCLQTLRVWYADESDRVSVDSLKDCSSSFIVEAPGYETRSFTLEQLVEWNYRVVLRPKIFQLEGVTVERLPFSPAFIWSSRDVVVLEERAIQQMLPRTSAEVLEESGEVFVQKSQFGGGSPILRGFEANRILLVVDGVRMNTAIFRSGHLQNILSVDPYSLDNVTVLFGPASLQYGSDALGGAVILRTKEPVLSSEVGRSAFHGTAITTMLSAANAGIAHIDASFGRYRWAIMGSMTISVFDHLRQGKTRNPFYGTWGLRSWYSAFRRNRDTVVRNPWNYWQVPSGYRQMDWMVKVVYDTRLVSRHLLNVQFSTTTYVPRYDRLTLLQENGYPRYAEWFYGPQQRLLIGYHTRFRFQRTLIDSAVGHIAYQYFEESRHTRGFGDPLRKRRYEKVDAVNVRVEAYGSSSSLQFVTGAELVQNIVRSRAYGENIFSGNRHPIPTRYPDGGSQMQWAAIFFLTRWTPSEFVEVSGGIRWNGVTLTSRLEDTVFYRFPFRKIEQNYATLTVASAVRWQPRSDLAMWSQFASGFRAPNVDDIAKIFDSKPGTVIMPNATLKPERTYTLDIGGEWNISTMRVRLVAFRTLFRNAIVIRPGQWDGNDTIVYDGVPSQVVLPQNSKQPAWIQGIRGTVHLFLSKQWELIGSYTATRGWRGIGAGETQPLSHIPPPYGRIVLQGKFSQFQCRFAVQWNQWKPLKEYDLQGEDNPQYATPFGMPAWWIGSIAIEWQLSPNIILTGELENVFDVFYRTFASGISGAGRSLNISMRAVW